ncbi:hypothetical protein OOZ51_12775 [Arthrobacter sp. MI7-26]|uniref:hypothetical protein n=1 Tax=Arthrobacter sp. MI7-26 TaxID=2993653 RepID=UPI00224929B6|nr:hypothetical protein [Arthrobacter sp. MI7-26]MCX2748680.1 hypothetical protein [Arthrobacter sp. MI7-26]
MGNIITKTFNHAEESNAAVFIREVLLAWTLEQGNKTSNTVHGLKGFFDDYDVPYRERRLRHLVQMLNELYKGRPGNQGRALIDRANTKVYDALEDLYGLPDTLKTAAKGGQDIFGRDALNKNRRISIWTRSPQKT